ncbi:MAG: (d)CMP kinase [Clostridiales bacterium]|nr:(d)CMP kinase [Clostridiales bacterium]
METRSIAIDGPSGAGKSTLAKMAAKELGIIYVDTGALYRAIALYTIRAGADTTDEQEISKLLSEITLEMKYDATGTQRVLLCGDDVTDEIRTPEVSIGASNVSALPPVRDYLLQMQRDMAALHDVIMDGRDIGTAVLPEARVKIFLSAAPEVRARRRYDELIAAGRDVTFEDVLRDINLRDHNDSVREFRPLRAAEGSVMLDTTDIGLEESFRCVLRIIEEKLHDARK